MTNYIIHRDEDYLEHFGTKGMKWGVRRYQNEDGSYKSGAEGRYAPDGQPGVNKGRKITVGGNSQKNLSSSSKKDAKTKYWQEQIKLAEKEEAERKAKKVAEKQAKADEKAAKKEAKAQKSAQLKEIDGLSDFERKIMYGVSAENNPLWKAKYGKKNSGDSENEKPKKETKEDKAAKKQAEKDAKTKYWQEQIKLAEKEEAERKAKKEADKQAKAEKKAADKQAKEAKKAEQKELQEKAVKQIKFNKKLSSDLKNLENESSNDKDFNDYLEKTANSYVKRSQKTGKAITAKQTENFVDKVSKTFTEQHINRINAKYGKEAVELYGKDAWDKQLSELRDNAYTRMTATIYEEIRRAKR